MILCDTAKCIIVNTVYHIQCLVVNKVHHIPYTIYNSGYGILYTPTMICPILIKFSSFTENIIKVLWPALDQNSIDSMLLQLKRCPDNQIDLQGHSVTFQQLLQYMDPSTWLDDLVLNQYCSLLKPTVSDSSIWLCSSFEYCTLEKVNQSKKFDSFIEKVCSFHSCLMPICTCQHWCVAHFFPHSREVRVYDSLYSANRNLEKSFHRFWGYVKDHKGWRSNLHITYPDVCKQTDGYSCGLFTLSFIKSIYARLPLDDVNSEVSLIRHHLVASVFYNKIV